MKIRSLSFVLHATVVDRLMTAGHVFLMRYGLLFFSVIGLILSPIYCAQAQSPSLSAVKSPSSVINVDQRATAVAQIMAGVVPVAGDPVIEIGRAHV